MALLYKYGTIYREVFHMKRTDVCLFVNAGPKDNIVVYQLVKILKDVDQNVIHNCPYTVAIYFLLFIFNLTLSSRNFC